MGKKRRGVVKLMLIEKKRVTVFLTHKPDFRIVATHAQAKHLNPGDTIEYDIENEKHGFFGQKVRESLLH